MPSTLVIVQFPRRILVHLSSGDVKEALDSINQPSRRRRRSRLVRQATLHFGAENLLHQASLRRTASRQVSFTSLGEDGKEATSDDDDDDDDPSDMANEHEEGEIMVDVEEMVAAVIVDFREAGYLQGDPTWTKTVDGKGIHVTFTCHSDLATLVVLKLEYIGIGSDVGAVNAVPVQVGRSAVHARRMAETKKKELLEVEEMKKQRSNHGKCAVVGTGNGVATESAPQLMDSARTSTRSSGMPVVGRVVDAIAGTKFNAKKKWGKFFIPEKDTKFLRAASVFHVEALSESIMGMSLFNFDYIALLMIASLIAAVGLNTDNSVTVVASMLVSPIMGPIMAFTFGYCIKDWTMVLSGIAVELVSLMLCLAVGFVYGWFVIGELTEDEWPTQQMSSRGDLRGLWYGMVVAIPSGMGVALSLLDQNTGGLVGVAISASLLPPAVGAGMYWSFAAFGPHRCSFHVDSEDMAWEGAISFALTLVNIVCVFSSALFMFGVKKVVPSQTNESFWKRDAKAAGKSSHESELSDLPTLCKIIDHQGAPERGLRFDVLEPVEANGSPTVLDDVAESKV